MAKRYVQVSKVRFDADTGEKMQLILGDEVDTVGPTSGETIKVTYRGRGGTVPKNAVGTRRYLEVYFLDVGQGDATLIVTPGRKKILIDGGKGVATGRIGEAEQALIWKYRLDEVNTPVDIDLVVLTHADEDHIGGLINLVMNPSITVKRVVHSGIATYKAPKADAQLGVVKHIAGTKFLTTCHKTLVDLDRTNLSDNFAAWVAVLELEGVKYERVEAGASIDIEDPTVTIDVLAPIIEQPVADEDALRWFGNRAHTINGHSVVLRLTHGQITYLFAGDLNIEGAELLLKAPQFAQLLDAHVLKAPHHGSHEYAPEFLAAVNPQITAISSGEIPDHGHPRANFLGAAGLFSRSNEPLLYSTALSAVFGKAEQKKHQNDIDALNSSGASDDAAKRDLFHKLLPGIINVRTDGQVIHAATRVQTSYQWVIYHPIQPVARTLPPP